MKKTMLVGVLALVAVLAILPGASSGEMYVEGYLGMAQGLNSAFANGVQAGHSDTADLGNGATASDVDSIRQSFSAPGRIDPALVGGLRLGAWFEQSGVLSGINFPAWMKFLGIYLDFKMHRLNFPPQHGPILWSLTGFHKVSSPGEFVSLNTDQTIFQGTGTFSSEGIAPTLAFMFAARYGFLPDKEVPFGRLQVYAAVGPALMFASQQPTLKGSNWTVTQRFRTFRDGEKVSEEYNGPHYQGVFQVTSKLDAASNVALCLAVDAGVRWMALKNVSLDLFFNYRYAQPSFTYDLNILEPWRGQPIPRNYWRNETWNWNPIYHLLGFGVGAAYHF